MIRKLIFINLVWALLILVICAIPGGTLPINPVFSLPYLDKYIHAALYFPFAFFLIALFDLLKQARFHRAGPWLTIIIVVTYGGLIELLQANLFLNRAGDFLDLLADIIGGLVGLTIYYLFFRSVFHKLSERHP